MVKTTQQQNELDKVEKHVLITLFGKESIPESTSVAFRMMNINPNDYIQKFEKMMIPLMNEDGMINGKMLKKVIYFSKYNDLFQMFTIPEEDFYLSEIIISLIKQFIPGVIA